MSGIKTGTPGFVNPLDGKVYTVDPKNLGDKTVNPVSETPDPGDIKIDDNVKDITKETKITLGKYLSASTKGIIGSSIVTNKYSIDPPTNNTPPSTIINEKGYPSQVTPSENSEQFSKILQSSTSKDFSELQSGTPKLKKGLSSESVPDGNELLINATIPASVGGIYIKNAKDLNEPVKSYTGIVIDDNTFNFSQQFLQIEINPDSPPPSFSASLNDIEEAEPKGSYSEVKKIPITLFKLRSKASQVTEINKFPISKPIEGPFDFLSPITNPLTNQPVPLGGFINNPSYIDRDVIKPPSTDASIKNFSKGKSKTSKYDGNNLLLKIEGNLNTTTIGAKTKQGIPTGLSGIGSDNPIFSYVGNRGSSVLEIGNNRWTPPTIPIDEGIENVGPNELIVSDPDVVEEKYNSELKLSDGSVASFKKLARVGVGLMKISTGDSNATSAQQFDPLNTSFITLPSGVKIGSSKVDNEILSARKVFDRIIETDNVSITSISNEKSWGSLTDSFQTFEGINGDIILTSALLLIVIALGTLFDLFGGLLKNHNIYPVPGSQMVKGKYKFRTPNLKSKLIDLLGIYETNNKYVECIGAGLKGYALGADKALVSLPRLALAATGIGLDTLLGNAAMVGSNLVLFRTIIRGASNLSQRLQELVTGFPTNPLGLLNLFSLIRSSILIKSLNVFAALGDNIINMSIGPVVYGPDGNFISVTATGFENLNPNQFGSHATVKKSRLTYLSTYDSTLAWSSQRSPALYLVSPKVKIIAMMDYEGKLGSFKGDLGLNSSTKFGNPIASVESEANGRISNEKRELMERLLDAEYVPFSFQDVRTNELISFHAFLTTLTDDYTANYESVEGFGRVEPIKVYRGTQRRIGLSFYIVSTSPSDFDHMWTKINKLTTMVYPQYTAGSQLTIPDPTDPNRQFYFTAPFSQLPGSSPLIRIRLGDLLRSNYSKFALARLFGIGNNPMKIPPSEDALKNEVNESSVINRLYQQYLSKTPNLSEEFEKSKRNFAINLGNFNKKLDNLPKGTKLDTSKIQEYLSSLRILDAKDRESRITDLRAQHAVAQKLNDDAGVAAIISSQIDAEESEKNIFSDVETISVKSAVTIDQRSDKDPEAYEKLQPAQTPDDDAAPASSNVNGKEDQVVYRVEIKYDSAIGGGARGATNRAQDDTIVASNVKEPDIKEITLKILIPKEYCVPISLELKTPDFSLATPAYQFQDSLVDFLKSEGNIIVKSFESSGGRGLAGFIESMNFDWYDKVTWETEIGRTAPKMCKVTINFSPIHDITPGIDSGGYNRAPIYPVGSAMAPSKIEVE